MNREAPLIDLQRVAVIIPALNEADNLRELLPELCDGRFGQVIVADNGSTDGTREIVEDAGAFWIHEPTRGYGAACFAAMQHLADCVDIVVFLDADLCDDASKMDELVTPIATGEVDFVVGARVRSLREKGSTSAPQRIANWLMPRIVKAGWGYSYTDLGPFRAIRRSSLEAVNMRDRAYGWTIEMQIRAVELGLKIREVSVPYRCRRRGRSKISGTVRGVTLAAYWIIRTCVTLYVTRGRRRAQANVAHAERVLSGR